MRHSSWGGVLPFGRQSSISGSNSSHCASDSITPLGSKIGKPPHRQNVWQLYTSHTTGQVWYSVIVHAVAHRCQEVALTISRIDELESEVQELQRKLIAYERVMQFFVQLHWSQMGDAYEEKAKERLLEDKEVTADYGQLGFDIYSYISDIIDTE